MNIACMSMQPPLHTNSSNSELIEQQRYQKVKQHNETKSIDITEDKTMVELITPPEIPLDESITTIDISKSVDILSNFSGSDCIYGEDESEGLGDTENATCKIASQRDRLATVVPHGFQLRNSFMQTHSAHRPFRYVTIDRRHMNLVALDDKGLTLWAPQSLTATPFSKRVVQFPAAVFGPYRCIVYAPTVNVFFVAGVDHTIKVLNAEFDIVHIVSSRQRCVSCLSFNNLRNELIAGGIGGVVIWRYHRKPITGSACDAKPMANFQLTLRLELDGCTNKNNVEESMGMSEERWVSKVHVDHQEHCIHVIADHDVLIYDSSSGTLLKVFRNVHAATVTTSIYCKALDYYVTGSKDCHIGVWTPQGARLYSFDLHAGAVTALCLHPKADTQFLSSSLDGTIRLWDLVTHRQIYRVKAQSDGLLGMFVIDSCHFGTWSRNEMQVWAINKVFSLWACTPEPVTTINIASCVDFVDIANDRSFINRDVKTQYSYSSRLFISSADGSGRLLDHHSGDLITTLLPPYVVSLMGKCEGVAYSRREDVFFVAVDPHTVWLYTAKTNPACRMAVWTQTSQPVLLNEPWTCMCIPGVPLILPTSSISSEYCEQDMIGRDIMVVGTQAGNLLLIDTGSLSGILYGQINAHKDPIANIEYDRSSRTLVTVSSSHRIHIWETVNELRLRYILPVRPAPLTAFCRIFDTVFMGYSDGKLDLVSLEDLVDVISDNNSYKDAEKAVMGSCAKLKIRTKFFRTTSSTHSKHDHLTASVLAMDSLDTLNILLSVHTGGILRIWDSDCTLVREVMLKGDATVARFLNPQGDIVISVGADLMLLQNHAYMPESLLSKALVSEDWDKKPLYESDVYEEVDMVESLTLETYTTPYSLECDHQIRDEERRSTEKEDVYYEDEYSDYVEAPIRAWLSPTPRRFEADDKYIPAQSNIFFGTSPNYTPIPTPPMSPPPVRTPTPPTSLIHELIVIEEAKPVEAVTQKKTSSENLVNLETSVTDIDEKNDYLSSRFQLNILKKSSADLFNIKIEKDDVEIPILAEVINVQPISKPAPAFGSLVATSNMNLREIEIDDAEIIETPPVRSIRASLLAEEKYPVCDEETKENIEENDVKEEINITLKVEEEVQLEVKEDVTEDVRLEVKEDIKREVELEVKEEVKLEVKEEVKLEVKEEVKLEDQEGVKLDVKKDEKVTPPVTKVKEPNLKKPTQKRLTTLSTTSDVKKKKGIEVPAQKVIVSPTPPAKDTMHGLVNGGSFKDGKDKKKDGLPHLKKKFNVPSMLQRKTSPKNTRLNEQQEHMHLEQVRRISTGREGLKKTKETIHSLALELIKKKRMIPITSAEGAQPGGRYAHTNTDNIADGLRLQRSGLVLSRKGHAPLHESEQQGRGKTDRTSPEDQWDKVNPWTSETSPVNNTPVDSYADARVMFNLISPSTCMSRPQTVEVVGERLHMQKELVAFKNQADWNSIKKRHQRPRTAPNNTLKTRAVPQKEEDFRAPSDCIASSITSKFSLFDDYSTQKEYPESVYYDGSRSRSVPISKSVYTSTHGAQNNSSSLMSLKNNPQKYWKNRDVEVRPHSVSYINRHAGSQVPSAMAYLHRQLSYNTCKLITSDNRHRAVSATQKLLEMEKEIEIGKMQKTSNVSSMVKEKQKFRPSTAPVTASVSNKDNKRQLPNIYHTNSDIAESAIRRTAAINISSSDINAIQSVSIKRDVDAPLRRIKVVNGAGPTTTTPTEPSVIRCENKKTHSPSTQYILPIDISVEKAEGLINSLLDRPPIPVHTAPSIPSRPRYIINLVDKTTVFSIFEYPLEVLTEHEEKILLERFGLGGTFPKPQLGSWDAIRSSLNKDDETDVEISGYRTDSEAREHVFVTTFGASSTPVIHTFCRGSPVLKGSLARGSKRLAPRIVHIPNQYSIYQQEESTNSNKGHEKGTNDKTMNRATVHI